MATGGADEWRAGRTETEGERRVLVTGRDLRELLELLELMELLELWQRQLRSRIAACEELVAAMAALRAALSPEEP